MVLGIGYKRKGLPDIFFLKIRSITFTLNLIP